MNVADVRRWMRAGEGQTIEFKETLAATREAIESLVAFFHARGGTVLFGVADDGRIVGAQLGKRGEAALANDIHRHTQPPLAPTIDAIKLEGHDVLAVRVARANRGQLAFAYGSPFVRVGKTNQRMTPQQQQTRLLANFKAENVGGHARALANNQSWSAREERRTKLYEASRGVFLVHTSRPSKTPRQVADVAIYLRQHLEGPLTEGTIKSVEYHLGPKFFDRTVVKTNAEESFKLEVSAYGPMLCTACVNFDDGSPPLELQRYIDF